MKVKTFIKSECSILDMIVVF